MERSRRNFLLSWASRRMLWLKAVSLCNGAWKLAEDREGLLGKRESDLKGDRSGNTWENCGNLE
jgi:hypothetical protein